MRKIKEYKNIKISASTEVFGIITLNIISRKFWNLEFFACYYTFNNWSLSTKPEIKESFDNGNTSN